MDYLPSNEHEIIFVCDGKRRYRTLQNKQNPPKCRRNLFQEADRSPKLEDSTGNKQTKDWITCLKSCLDTDNTSSLNQFQSYIKYMNAYEEERNIKSENQRNNQTKVDTETGKEFIVLNNCSQYDNFEDREVIVKQNNGHFVQNIILSPDLTGNYYSDVMLSSDDTVNVISDSFQWEETTVSPSGDKQNLEILGCDIDVDHEEVIQSISGSFDTLSCYSDDFSGSDEGFPDDFMDDDA